MTETGENRARGGPWWWNRPRSAVLDITLGVLSAMECAVQGESFARDAGIPVAFALVLGVVAGGALVLRRRWPIAVVMVAIAVIPAEMGTMLGVVGLYTLAATEVPRRITALLAAMAAAGTLVMAVVRLQQDIGSDPDFNPSSWFVPLVAVLMSIGMTAPPVLLGLYVGARRRLVESLRERADGLERELSLLADRAEERAEWARNEERTRIAREMHDVVAHRVSLMVVHAAALQAVALKDPEKAAKNAALVGDMGRQALNELRTMLGVLRAGDSKSDKNDRNGRSGTEDSGRVGGAQLSPGSGDDGGASGTSRTDGAGQVRQGPAPDSAPADGSASAPAPDAVAGAGAGSGPGSVPAPGTAASGPGEGRGQEAVSTGDPVTVPGPSAAGRSPSGAAPPSPAPSPSSAPPAPPASPSSPSAAASSSSHAPASSSAAGPAGAAEVPARLAEFASAAAGVATGARRSEVPEAPSLVELEVLVGQSRTAGMAVELSVEGEPGAGCTRPVEQTAYRVVQEALTNVHKHAAGARTRVRLAHREAEVALQVENEPPAAGAADARLPSGGNGLVGMRERVMALGGGFVSGPTDAGGFRVSAVIPYEGR
ncbi:histidine kinase [Streptomyces iconiensis]|uniref:histidine kinase n=1 Tax=Streptomyces iconiensis TaxID=1384038 RepID=A0ABT7A5D9_9ACTN|nr:histidine kinase [Streptomyces iconiensis]MDJ1136540.1 histidine kinase [Streptomyces iconiensis]